MTDSLLIYVPVPFKRHPNGSLMVEAQAANGLRQWVANFAKVVVMAPVDDSTNLSGWVELSVLGESKDRVVPIGLPMVYRPDRFLRALPQVRCVIRQQISQARWLCFAIGGLFGDWGAVASIEAARMGRPFAVWTDRVESEVARLFSKTASGKAALRAKLTHRPMALLERYVIGRAAVGLFHGKDTFEAYSKYCKKSEIVHDVHLKKSDQISESELAIKITQSKTGLLKIFYAGRVDPDKGPFDWLISLSKLKNEGVAFNAEWLGGGSQIDAFRMKISEFGLQDEVKAPGPLLDRSKVLQKMQNASIFMFCHLVPESPRCLVESLMCGTPIVGYSSPYSEDLISMNGGGILTPKRDTDALTRTLAKLGRDRGSLGKLIRSAALDGRQFDDETVFRHRSELIKRYS